MTPRTLPRVLALASLAAFLSCAQVVGLSSLHDGICTPGETRECPYTGPAETKDVGNCKAGTQTCNGDGQSWSTCSGEVLPQKPLSCLTSAQDTCTGQMSTGCCAPGSTTSCYDGPAATEGKGICKGGTKTCGSDAQTYGACMGEVTPKQETCASTDDEDCDGLDCVEWAELLGDGAPKVAEGAVVDASGNIYVVGSYGGSISAGSSMLVSAGTFNAFLLKLDPTGKPLWGKSFGDTAGQSFDAVALDAQGHILVGGRTADAAMLDGKPVPAGLFAAMLGTDGSTVWVKGLTTMTGCTSSDSNLWSIAATSGGDVVIGGYYCGTIDFGTGAIASSSRAAFVGRLSGTDGSAVWGKSFADPGKQMQEIQRVRVDGSDNVIVAGEYQGTLDVGLGPISSYGGYDAFTAKLDSTGKALWYERLGCAGDQKVTDLVLDASGGPVVTGTFDQCLNIGGVTQNAMGSGTNGFVLHYSAADAVEWYKLLPTATASAAVDGTGDVVLYGQFSDSIDLGSGPLTVSTGTYEQYLAKLSAAGDVKWQRGFTNVGGGTLSSVVTTNAAGESIVAGGMVGKLDFGSGTLSMSMGFGAFVAKFGL